MSNISILASVVTSVGSAYKSFPSKRMPLQVAIDLLSNALTQWIVDHKVVRAKKKPRVVIGAETLPPNTPLGPAEISGCKALMLEIIRRASYDWVLYRTSKVLQKRRLAEDAFNWLFSEGPGHQDWMERISSEKEITSFIAICQALDLDPDMVRGHVRRLTVQNVMSIGRPAEYRKQDWREDETYNTSSMGERLLSEIAGSDDLSSFDGLTFEGE